jgi:hypothetical protein
MKAFSSIFVAGLLLLLIAGCDSQKNEALPSRSDCIVRINMYWPNGLDASRRESIINNIDNAIGFSSHRGGPKISIDTSFPRDRRDVFYVQFGENCRHRLRVAHRLVGYLERTLPRAPQMQVSKKVIKPNVSTIDVWGPQWSDSDKRM